MNDNINIVSITETWLTLKDSPYTLYFFYNKCAHLWHVCIHIIETLVYGKIGFNITYAYQTKWSQCITVLTQNAIEFDSYFYLVNRFTCLSIYIINIIYLDWCLKNFAPCWCTIDIWIKQFMFLFLGIFCILWDFKLYFTIF